MSSHFHLLENLGDLSGRAIFRERFPLSHSLAPIGILAGRRWELTAAHLVLKIGFLELADDNPIRPAHLDDHGVNLLVQSPELQLARRRKPLNRRD